MKTTVTASLS